jgi:hypothetical protein
LENISDFFSNAVEFLVGGVLFSMSVAFLILAGSTVPRLNPYEVSLLSATATIILGLGVAVAYAMGVVAESLARSLFEILLDRITVRNEAFLPGNSAPAPGVAPASGKLGAWRNRITEFALGGEYTVRQRNVACDERERQRTKVMTCHVSLHAEVQGRLRRLRLERVFALSLAVTTFALVIRGQWRYAALGLVVTAAMVWLVNMRLKRYCGAIAGGFRLVDEENMRQVPQGLTIEPGI